MIVFIIEIISANHPLHISIKKDKPRNTYLANVKLFILVEFYFSNQNMLYIFLLPKLELTIYEMEKTSYDPYKNFQCQSKASINVSDYFKEI